MPKISSHEVLTFISSGSQSVAPRPGEGSPGTPSSTRDLAVGWIEDIALHLHQKPTGGVREVRLVRVTGREQVKMPPRAGEMEAVRQPAPVALVRAGTALHHGRDDARGGRE
jgi:hypothetical protein